MVGRKSPSWPTAGEKCKYFKVSKRVVSKGLFDSLSPHMSLEFLSQFRQEEGASPPLSPQNGGIRTPGSRPTTPNLTLSRVTNTLDPKDPIQTAQQFYDWLSLVERSIARSQEAHFHAYVADVSEHLEKCDQLVSGINRLDVEIEQMLEKWRVVGEGGLSLKGECEKLLEERVFFFYSA
jgi:conserved oligomeric Golgi complex subunit 3